MVGTKRMTQGRSSQGLYLEEYSIHSNMILLALILFAQTNVFLATSKAGLKQRRVCSF